MRELDVSYVLVIFGGLTGYSSDGEYAKQWEGHRPVQTIDCVSKSATWCLLITLANVAPF